MLLLVRAQALYQPAEIGELMRIAVDTPIRVAVNSVDGSCWVVTFPAAGQSRLIHFAADGTELWRSGEFSYPRGLDVNPADGSCWVIDEPAQPSSPKQEILVHLAADGTELWRGGGYLRPCNVGGVDLHVNPADGSCWMAGCAQNNYVLHMAPDGSAFPDLPWHGQSISPVPSDGSYWQAECISQQAVHLSSTGDELARGPKAYCFGLIAADADGSCFVAVRASSPNTGKLMHLDAQGNVVWETAGFISPDDVAVNPLDGFTWMSDVGDADNPASLVRLDADGNVLWRGGDFSSPWDIAGNVTDGSCWVADSGSYNKSTSEYVGGALVHLGLLRYANFTWRSPLAQGDARGFRHGSIIPVKFTLTDLAGHPANGVKASLRVYSYAGDVRGNQLTIMGSVQFRKGTAGTYLLNLSAQGVGWKRGSYLAVVTLDDGEQFTQTFSLK